MKKPFTPIGLQDLLTELYALSDIALAMEAANLAADLRTWLQDKFILSPSQVLYILAVDNRQIAATANEAQYFIARRLPIVLIKDDPLTNQVLADEGKFFELKKLSSHTYAPSEGYSEEELLTVHIYYT
jgi:hypothetical protein